MRYVLFISADSVTSYAVGRSGFDAPVIFHHQPDSHTRFGEYLLERKDSTFSVVLDSQDEEHYSEMVPLLRGRDQARAVEQVVKRADARGPYLICVSRDFCQSETTGSNSDTTAVRKTLVTVPHIGAQNDCRHWFQMLDSHGTLIDAVCPLSLLAQQVLSKLQPDVSLCVLRLHQNEYRVIGFRAGLPVINRHLNHTDIGADSLLAELDKTRDYLRNYQIRDAAVSLPANSESRSSTDDTTEPAMLIGLVSSEIRQVLEAGGVQVLSEHRLYKLLPHRNPTASFAIEMMVALMVDRKVRSSTRYRGNYNSHLTRRKTRHSMLAGVVCCLGMSAFATTAAVKVDGRYSSLQTLVESQRETLRDLAVPNIESAVEDLSRVDALRQSLRLAQQMESVMQVTPLHFLSPFAGDLSQYPEVSISGVQWSSPDVGGLQPAVLQPGQVRAEGVEAVVGYDASVTGYLRFADGEITEAVERFNSFVRLLKRSERYHSVEVIEAPFGISDQSTTYNQASYDGTAVFHIAVQVSGEGYESKK
jgi:hypothetical protein